MNRPTRYERAPLDVVVAEKERRRRRQDGDSRLPLPLYDTALPVPAHTLDREREYTRGTASRPVEAEVRQAPVGIRVNRFA